MKKFISVVFIKIMEKYIILYSMGNKKSKSLIYSEKNKPIIFYKRVVVLVTPIDEFVETTKNIKIFGVETISTSTEGSVVGSFENNDSLNSLTDQSLDEFCVT